MESFKGYVLQAELAHKAKVSLACFDQIKNIKTKKMGHFTCIFKKSLPLKYKQIAEKECLDLEKYRSYSYFSFLIGMGEDYILYREREKGIKFKEAGNQKLIELSEEFIEKINTNLTPFKIRNKADGKLAKEIIQMQGLKIGFY